MSQRPGTVGELRETGYRPRKGAQPAARRGRKGPAAKRKR